MQDLNDKLTGGTLGADEWNQVPSEIQNVIESLGITLSAGDLNQLGKAIAGYVANGSFYTDSGAANAYVLSPVGLKKSPPAYADGMRAVFYAANGNTGASTVNISSIGVVDIRTEADAALPSGTLVAGGRYELSYYAVGGWFRLLSLAAPVAPEIHGITATVGSNALTVNILPQYIEFRSVTLTDGTPVKRQVGSTISMTVSSGSTLGTVNGVASRLAVIALDNSGTVEVAIVNVAGGTNLDESGLISTTAEGGAGGADSATVIYSTTARANVPYRVLGFVDSTQATAGTWATSPTIVQGAGGNAGQSLQSIGHGQKWQLVTRTPGTTYYNTTGKPIMINFNGIASSLNQEIIVDITVNGITFGMAYDGSATGATSRAAGRTIIPAGASYSVAHTGVGTHQYTELR